MVTFLKLLLKQGIMGSPTPSYSGKSIQIISIQQPNRILIHKPTRIRLVIVYRVIVQPSLFIEVLVLQSKRLMRILINPPVLFQTVPASVVAEP